MSENPRAAPSLCILDCLSGERVVVQKSPFVIGTLPSSDLQLSAPSSPQVLCTIVQDGGGFHVSFGDQVLLNGASSRSVRVMPGGEYSVVGRECMISLKHTDRRESWLSHDMTLLWNVYDTSVHDWLGPFTTQQLRGWLSRLASDARRHLVLVPAGMEEAGFSVKDVQDLLSVASARDLAVEGQGWCRR